MWPTIWHVTYHLTCDLPFDMWSHRLTCDTTIWHVTYHLTCDLPFDMWPTIWHVTHLTPPYPPLYKNSEMNPKLTCDPYNKPHILQWISGKSQIFLSPFYLHFISIFSSFYLYFISIYFLFYLHFIFIYFLFYLLLFSIFSSFFFLIYLSSLFFLILNYLFRINNSIHSFIPFYFSGDMLSPLTPCSLHKR